MKKNLLVIVMLGAVMFSACAQQKNATKSKVMADTKPKPGITFLAMERTACFGTCPTYRLEINKDGSVKFISWMFTEYEGTYEKKFDPAKVAELYRKFEAYRVDTCAEQYESLIQDVPGVNFYFTWSGGKEQQILNAHFGPEYFRDMANETDYFSKVDETWTKTADKTER